MNLRLFLAVPVTGPLLDQLTDLLIDLHSHSPQVRWVPPAHVHITLRFLGDVADERLPEVRAWADAAIAGSHLDGFRLGQPGYFQHADRIIFWMGVSDPGWITALAERLGGAVAGVPAESRAFVAHLTLGRFKGAINPALKRFLAFFSTLAPPDAAQESARVVLYRSHLAPTGTRYEELASWPPV